MLKSLARNLLKDELVQKDEEIKELKRKLQYRHTTINDLRYKTKILEQMVSVKNDSIQDELQQSPRVASKISLFTKPISNFFNRRSNGSSASTH